jgi:hypothetical protein
MYEDLQFDRAKRTITEKVYVWPAAKTVRLSDAEAAEVESVLGAFCLARVTGEPAPPPGGPTEATITSAGSGERRLGVKGRSGGDFYVLTSEEWSRMLEELKKMSPEHRDCLPLGKDGTSFSGKLLETTRPNEAPRPGEKYPLVLVEGTVCVAPEGATPLSGPPVVMAGSIEVRPASSVPPALKGKPVTATGKLFTEKEGDKTNVVMTVSALKER